MTAMQSRRRTRLALRGLPLAAALGVLAGCAVAPTTPTVMVLPGSQKSAPQFQADAATCQQRAQGIVAPMVDAANNQAASSVVVGTVIGAAAGALLGQGSYNPGAVAAWGAGTGMLMGSAAAGGSSQVSQLSLQQQYNIAYVQCMYQLGHQVPGQLVSRRPVYGAPAPPPPPPPNWQPQTAPAQGYPPPMSGAPLYPPPGTPPPAGVQPGYAAPPLTN